MWQRLPGFLIAIAWWASCGTTQKGPQESLTFAPRAAEAAPQPADETTHLPIVNLAESSAALPGVSPLASVVGADREPLLACFGALAGDVTMHLELRPDGGVAGGSTDPAGGQAGMAAVADCVLDRARGWQFPRAHDEATRILIVPLSLQRATSSSAER